MPVYTVLRARALHQREEPLVINIPVFGSKWLLPVRPATSRLILYSHMYRETISFVVTLVSVMKAVPFCLN